MCELLSEWSRGPQTLKQLVKTDPVDGAVLLAGAMGIEQVFAVGGDVLSPAMREAVVDLWSEAYRKCPRRIGFAEGDVKFRLVGFGLFGADDHVGLVGGDVKVAIESGFGEGGAKAIHGGRAIGRGETTEYVS